MEFNVHSQFICSRARVLMTLRNTRFKSYSFSRSWNRGTINSIHEHHLNYIAPQGNAQNGDWTGAEEGQGKGAAPHRQPDDVDKFLNEMINFVRDPWSFVVRFARFVAASLDLTRQFYCPSFSLVVSRTLGVFVVVFTFCLLVNTVDTIFAQLPRFYQQLPPGS